MNNLNGKKIVEKKQRGHQKYARYESTSFQFDCTSWMLQFERGRVLPLSLIPSSCKLLNVELLRYSY